MGKDNKRKRIERKLEKEAKKRDWLRAKDRILVEFPRAEACLLCGKEHEVDPEINFVLLVKTKLHQREHMHVCCEAAVCLGMVEGLAPNTRLCESYAGVCGGPLGNEAPGLKTGLAYIHGLMDGKNPAELLEELCGLTKDQIREICIRASQRVKDYIGT